MFETGMSALVLKICSEYAKSLGLNFPPCTQQEINAICQWVDKHAVKDMTISQDGYIVTFTFKGEYDTTKEFTITIPKNVNIDELEKVLLGSDTVVVNRTEDNSKLQVRLAQSVTDKINGKLDKPATPTAESAVVIGTNGTVGTKPLSEIGGGKLYLHKIHILDTNSYIFTEALIYSSSNTPFTFVSLISFLGEINAFVPCANSVATGYIDTDTVHIHFVGIELNSNKNILDVNFTSDTTDFTDTVTEI